MKSRISFFNAAALRKDITRFLPVWLLYLIGSLLIGLDTISSYSYDTGYAANELSESLTVFGVINFIYALVCAQMLFGDLFNSKLCNALHAMPVRRESWFLTHTMAGIAFSVVPNLILSLCFMPFMDGMWYVSLIWLLGVTLQYIFFFGLAALSAVCAGNRLGMAAIYGIANFLSVIIMWFVSTFYEPQLYGLHLRYEVYEMCCPVVWIAQLDELVVFNVPKQTVYPGYGYYEEVIRTYTFNGLSADWWYLAVLAAVGLAFLALGVVLYRRRRLESAGDLLAFQSMKPVFTVIFTLCSGAVAEVLGESFMGAELVFLIVGIIVGYFACQMLMQRTVKVFRKMAFVKCAAIGVALAVSILLTMWDPIGITRWVPEPEKVDSIILSGSYYFESDLPDEDLSRYAMVIDNPVLIEELTGIHQQLLTEEEVDKYSNSNAIHLTYRMKDGRSVVRRYYYAKNGPAGQRMKRFTGTPEYIMGYKDWDAYLDTITGGYANWNYDEKLTVEDARALAEAIKADCESSDMSQSKRDDWSGTVHLTFEDGTEFSIDYFPDSQNIQKWLQDHGYT